MASTSETVMVTGIRRDDQPATAIIPTPDHEPNIIYQTITPIFSILIRSGRSFCQALLSGLTAAQAGTVLNIEVLKHLQFREIFILATATPGICALQNTIELLAKLDQKFPMFRGA